MHATKTRFIQLALECEVLSFGEFRLKSGRLSPYFFNAGLFNTGRSLAELGSCYAQTIVERRLDYNVLFGPAYKGIPLVAAIAVALATQYGIDRPWAFNRKEAKSHGEGGSIVGAPLAGRVLIVDDVITAGTAIREAVDIIDAAGGRPSDVMIALDREEKGRGELSAIQEVERDFSIGVHSIITLTDLISYLETEAGMQPQLDMMRKYRDQYGI